MLTMTRVRGLCGPATAGTVSGLSASEQKGGEIVFRLLQAPLVGPIGNLLWHGPYEQPDVEVCVCLCVGGWVCCARVHVPNHNQRKRDANASTVAQTELGAGQTLRIPHFTFHIACFTHHTHQ